MGQEISSKKYWNDGTPVAGQQFEYGFDDIGNRTTTKAGGDVKITWGSQAQENPLPLTPDEQHQEN